MDTAQDESPRPRLFPRENSERVALVLLWVLALGAGGWFLYPDSIDHAFFKWLNSSLVGRPASQRLFAFSNTRAFDLLAGLVLAAYFLVPGPAFASDRRRDAILGFVPVALLFQPWRELVGHLSGEKPSPGRVFWNDMVRLDELNPAAKVASDHSFPSDHTAVLLVWAAYIVGAGDKSLRWTAAPMAVVLSFPRLIGGGHWLSDAVFGSPLVAFPPLIVLFYFDLPDRFLSRIVPRLRRRP